MEQEQTLNAHNKLEFPPMHTTEHIIKPFQYPTLKDQKDIECQKTFLKEINDVSKIIEGRIETINDSIKKKSIK